jgi:LmbE family N-acetylglucosaminyl deacetylase
VTEEQADEVSRCLVVAAHPDDIDFGAAGTIAAWTSTGMQVTYCVCTSGEAGDIEGVPRHRVGEIRRDEQLAAAAEVGVRDVVFLDHPDGRLTPSLELRRDITRVIRTVRPHRVVTWSPEINWDFVVTAHPDHRAVGESTFAAVYPDARNPHAHPELLADEGLQPWTVAELWLVDSPARLVNRAVDVTEHFPAKLAALHAHKSQTARIPELAAAIERHLTLVAERNGLSANRLAEAFQVVKTA